MPPSRGMTRTATTAQGGFPWLARVVNLHGRRPPAAVGPGSPFEMPMPPGGDLRPCRAATTAGQTGRRRCDHAVLVRVGGRGSARYPHRVACVTTRDLATSDGLRCLPAAGAPFDWGMWSAVTWFGANKEKALFAAATVLLVAGGVAWLLDADTAASVLWIAGTCL